MLAAALCLLLGLSPLGPPGPARAAPKTATAEEIALSGNLHPSAARPVQARLIVSDSLGRRHSLLIRFARQPQGNAWEWRITTPARLIRGPDPLAAGVIAFDEQGEPVLAPGQPEGLLRLVVVGRDGRLREEGTLRIELDRVTGRFATSRLTQVSTRALVVDRIQTAPPTGTPAERRAPVATRTPTRRSTGEEGPILEWLSAPIVHEVTSGTSTVQTVTFAVRERVNQPRLILRSRGGTLEADPLPDVLEPGVEYDLRLVMSPPPPGQRQVGTIGLATRHGLMLGPTQQFIVSLGYTPPTPTRTQVPWATPTPVGEPTPTFSSRVFEARVRWIPGIVQQVVGPDEEVAVEVAVEASNAIENPSFHVFGRAGAVRVDPSSLPERLDPHAPHMLRLILVSPAGRRGRSESATIGLRVNGRTIRDRLIVRVVPEN